MDFDEIFGRDRKGQMISFWKTTMKCRPLKRSKGLITNSRNSESYEWISMKFLGGSGVVQGTNHYLLKDFSGMQTSANV